MVSNALLLFLLTLSPQLPPILSNKAQGSCEDYNIVPGPDFNETCLAECAPGAFEIRDWAQTDSEKNALVRTSVCRCCNEEGECQDPETLLSKWECWSTRDVWDLSQAVETCDDYDITSQPSCETFCTQDIDPIAYDWRGSSSSAVCKCAGVTICDGNEALGIAPSESGAHVIPTTSIGFIIASIFYLLY